MTKIVHTADVHLGKSQWGIPERKQDFVDAFREIIDGCIRREVDALVITGDLFEKENPTEETIQKTVEAIDQLTRSERSIPPIPVYLIHGDHASPPDDAVTPGIDAVIEQTHATRLSSDPTLVGDNVALYGIHNEDLETVIEGAIEFATPPEDRYVIFCTHLMPPRFNYINKPAYKPSQILRSVPIAVDMMLCGELHKDKCLTYQGTPVYFPGAPARIKSNLADHTPRVYLHEITTDELNSETYRVPVRPWENVEVEVAVTDDIDDVLSQIHDQIDVDSGEGELILTVNLNQEPDEISIRDVRDKLNEWDRCLSAQVFYETEHGGKVGTNRLQL